MTLRLWDGEVSFQLNNHPAPKALIFRSSILPPIDRGSLWDYDFLVIERSLEARPSHCETAVGNNAITSNPNLLDGRDVISAALIRSEKSDFQSYGKKNADKIASGSWKNILTSPKIVLRDRFRHIFLAKRHKAPFSDSNWWIPSFWTLRWVFIPVIWCVPSIASFFCQYILVCHTSYARSCDIENMKRVFFKHRAIGALFLDTRSLWVPDQNLFRYNRRDRYLFRVPRGRLTPWTDGALKLLGAATLTTLTKYTPTRHKNRPTRSSRSNV